MNLTDASPASLVVRANDEAAAQQVEQIFDKALETARQQAAAEFAKDAKASTR